VSGRARRCLVAAALAVLGLLAVADVARAEGDGGEGDFLTVRLRIRIARCSGADTRSASWVSEHVDEADRVLRHYGIRLTAHQETFTPERCELLTAADRSSLAGHVSTDDAVTVLVVPRVRDLDVITYDLMGVHWRYAGRDERLRGRRWIFLTARARPPVLAHELGHYFGLPHDPAGGNLMTPGESSPIRKMLRPKPFAPVLTKRQAAIMRAHISRFMTRRLSFGDPSGGRSR